LLLTLDYFLIKGFCTQTVTFFNKKAGMTHGVSLNYWYRYMFKYTMMNTRAS